MKKHLLHLSAITLFALGTVAACSPTGGDANNENDGTNQDLLADALCLGSQAGAYCGNDMMQNADANALYQCPGANMKPTSAVPCAGECIIAPPGVPDYCDPNVPVPGKEPLCLGSQAGAYCGADMMENADPNTLYNCPGANKAPTSSTPCSGECIIAPPGSPDYCKDGGNPGNPGGYRFPWPAGTSMQLTQDCNDSCCSDHVGNDKYAWDFANGGSFTVVAARGGTISHLKINSTTGCGTKTCVDYANYMVIDHGDGTQSTYLHLEGFSLAQGLSCGSAVNQGQALANAGSTGWSTGTHLHFEVSKVHSGAKTCECGSDGQGCADSDVAWSGFWPNATYPTVAISFDEWADASQCADRGGELPASMN